MFFCRLLFPCCRCCFLFFVVVVYVCLFPQNQPFFRYCIPPEWQTVCFQIRPTFCFVWLVVGPNCLQRLSADDKVISR